MRADFPVVLDACVLAESAVSDLFLRLSEEPRLLLPKWSERIWEETRRTYVEKLGWAEDVADSRINAAQKWFPEAMVAGYEHLVPSCTNHPDDRHVLAAAIHSKAETVVTFNVRDFGRKALDPWGIAVAYPGDYLKVLYDHDPDAVTTALRAMAAKAKRTMPEMLARLAWYVPDFTGYVAAAQAIDVPCVPPREWRRD